MAAVAIYGVNKHFILKGYQFELLAHVGNSVLLPAKSAILNVKAHFAME